MNEDQNRDLPNKNIFDAATRMLESVNNETHETVLLSAITIQSFLICHATKDKRIRKIMVDSIKDQLTEIIKLED